MGTLPMDIILSCILPKLPTKSLIRFKCVSKSFLAEISLPKFIKQQHQNVISSNSNRLLILPIACQGVYVYDLDSPHTLPSFCPYPDVTFYAPYMSVVATCEGFLLIGCFFTQLSSLILLNPSTHTYREISCENIPNNSENVLYGIWHCLDEFYDEYRVVRFVNLDEIEGVRLEVMVYNTTTNTWKVVESKTTVDTFESWDDDNTPVLVQNHLLHLLFFNQGHDAPPDHIKRIGCFDVKAERWANDVQLPDVLWDENVSGFSLRRPCNLGELDDQLCLTGYNVIESSFELWAMKEYAMKESWVKLISLRVSSDLDKPRLQQESYHPLAYRTGSHELLYIQGCYNCKFHWYNLRDKEAIEVEFPPPLGGRHNWDFLAYICKGSLLNFPGGRPIRVSLEEEHEDGDEDEEEEEDNDEDGFLIS